MTKKTRKYESPKAYREIQMKLVKEDPFLSRIQKLKEAKDKDGNRLYTEREIAEFMGMHVGKMRNEISKRYEAEYERSKRAQ